MSDDAAVAPAGRPAATPDARVGQLPGVRGAAAWSRQEQLLAAFALCCSLLLAACGADGASGGHGASGRAGRPGAGGPRASGRQLGGQLSIYIWTNYLPDEVVKDFERRTGIEATVDTYDSNEVLLAKLQSGVAGFDLVAPSDYLLQVATAQHLLRPLDHSRLPGLANLDRRFLDRAFDPGNRFSLPYLWGTTGIGYDRRQAGGAIDSWRALFDERRAGRILMLDDMREAFGAALRVMGRSINERDPAVLRRAADLLKRQQRLVKVYNSSDFANLLAAGDMDLAQGYSGELAEVVARDPVRFAYVVPREGGTLWIDNLAIPAAARHIDAAYAFLDYVLRPEVMARIVNRVHYAAANQAAIPLIDPKIKADPAIYAPPEVLARCELITDLGPANRLLDQLWTEVKAQ